MQGVFLLSPLTTQRLFLDRLLKKQLAFMLARQQISVETEDEDLQNCINNTHLTTHFLNLARELDLMEPKTPEDIYKSHLEHKREYSWTMKSQ